MRICRDWTDPVYDWTKSLTQECVKTMSSRHFDFVEYQFLSFLGPTKLIGIGTFEVRKWMRKNGRQDRLVGGMIHPELNEQHQHRKRKPIQLLVVSKSRTGGSRRQLDINKTMICYNSRPSSAIFAIES